VPQRILVVDDEPEICDLLTIWFGDDPRCDCVMQAHDLDMAVQLAAREHPDVILLDFHVGPRTSVEALPALRRSCPNARILLHTGNRDDALRAEVEGNGVDCILEKATLSIPDVVEVALG